jgi:hypothetical protein
MTVRDDDEQRTAAIGIRVKPSVKAELERLAKAEHRPLSNYLQVLLEEHIEMKKQEAKRKGKRDEHHP